MEKAEEREFFSRDGLISRKRNVEDENVDVELSLGLSLNGNFGVDPKKPKIVNPSSSSVTNVVHSGDRNDNEFQFSLIRGCLVPAETKEEWRQRKELQSLNRLEAKQKRWEKMKNVRVVKENEASLLSSGGSHEGSVASSETAFETQQLPIQGPNGSTNVRPLASDLSFEGMQKLIAEALETTNEKSPVLSLLVLKNLFLLKANKVLYN